MPAHAQPSSNQPASPQPPAYGLPAALGLIGLVALSLLLGCGEARGEHAPPAEETGAHEQEPRPTRVELIVETSHRAGTLGAPTARLAQKLRDQLGQSLRVHADADHPTQGPWTVGVAVLDASVRQRYVGAHNVPHEVEVFREIKNPELDDLHRRLEHAAEQKTYWEHLAREHWAAYRWLKEKYEETGEAQWKRMQPKYYTQAGRSESRMNEAREAFHDAKHALACAPRWITVAETQTRPVRVETHRQTGTVTATVTLRDAGGAILAQKTLDAACAEDDQTIAEPPFARRGHDLPDDPLVFTDPRAVIDRLLDEVADDAVVLVRSATR
ncbi:MAG: hypothetical protein GVY24_02395 [Planctomycetes bacterium]|jgi:hypothetical protein|nr:hypothetical protein [Planctomycetota bacterium]